MEATTTGAARRVRIPRPGPHGWHDVAAVELVTTGGPLVVERRAVREVVGTFRLHGPADGSQRPYFSATGEVWGRSRREPETCGAIGEALAEVWPDSGVVVRVHLSDDRGVPMHAAANAAYWAGMAGRFMPERDRGGVAAEPDAQGRRWAPLFLASHLRVTVDEATELWYEARKGWTGRGPAWPFDTAARWAEVIDAAGLPARWAAEAAEALAWIQARAAEVSA